jgi:hypothetical protein
MKCYAKVMNGVQNQAALDRIQRALARIEAVAARPVAPARGVAALESRNTALRASTAEALKDLAALIAAGAG